MAKGELYTFEDGKDLMCITQDLKVCPNCLTVNGMIKINVKDFSLYDVAECFDDFISGILDDLTKDKENKIED